MFAALRSPFMALVIAFFTIADAALVIAAANYRPATWQREPRIAYIDILRPSADTLTGHADGAFLSGKSMIGFSLRDSATVPERSPFVIRGWAIDTQRMQPFLAMLLSIDGGKSLSVPYGVRRPDVAAALHCAPCEDSGYAIAFTAQNLRRGKHVLRTRFVTPNGDGAVDGPTISLEVR